MRALSRVAVLAIVKGRVVATAFVNCPIKRIRAEVLIRVQHMLSKALLNLSAPSVPLWPPHRVCKASVWRNRAITTSAPTPILSTSAQFHHLILHHALPHPETQLLSQHFSDHNIRLLPRLSNHRARSVQQSHLWQPTAVELRGSIGRAAARYSHAVFRGATGAPTAGDELDRIRRSPSARPEAQHCGGAEVVEYMSVSVYLSLHPACEP